MQFYVGTYRKYNNGDISGAWFDPSDYRTFDDLMEAVKAAHSDESDPELMVQDWDDAPNIGKHFGQTMPDESAFDALKEVESDNWDAFDAYVGDIGPNAIDSDLVESFKNDYRGKYDREIDFIYEWVEEIGLFEGASETMQSYFDYEAYSRDRFIDDFSFVDGYVFSR